MSGINSELFTAVSQLRACFEDGLNTPKNIIGTGFWLKFNDKNVFVTNKHNLDPTLKLGNHTPYKLKKIEIQLRKTNDVKLILDNPPEPHFFEVDTFDKSLQFHTDADVALLIDPIFDSAIGFSFNWFSFADLATEQFLSDSVFAMDIASFIGYPGTTIKDKQRKLWDMKWHLPVARVCNIASWPKVSFQNPGIMTSDVCLVSGLSFLGSSGSPIILHEKGIRTSGGLSGGNYVAPKILGIMSGHWWNEESHEDFFFHSGISYFTRSTSILELLAAE